MKTAVRRILLMSALMSPGALYALGLGEIHLNSGLNQPFDADIELVSATQEDLGALRAALASNDTFARYGLDRPDFLSDFTFRVAKGPGGQDVLKVTSPRPVSEPFVTLLVEANWPRGRLLREYTVLLDPPVFAPTPGAAEAPVAAPRSTAAATQAAGPETAEASPAGSAGGRTTSRSVAASRAGIEPGSTYRVHPNDTLYEIAAAANPGSRSDVNRAMVAIFQGNPEAFEGNINRLRSGSVLKIPSSGEVAAISASAASAEVARQYQLWKEGAASAAGGEGSGRLRLVTPEQGTAAPSTSTRVPASPAGEGQAGDLKARVSQLESELAEAKRLLEVKSAELATLQAQQARPGQPAPAAQAPAPGEAAVPPPSTEAPVPPEAAGPPPAAEPSAAAPRPEAPKPAKPQKPPKKTPPPAPEPSLLDRVTEYWWVLLGLLAVVAGGLLVARQRRERGAAETDLEEALGRDLRAAARTPVVAPRARDTEIVVEEKRPVEPTAPPASAPAAAEPARRPVAIEDTISGDVAASIEAGDPLAEADFHMAYGLYDQAADLVQLALKREPKRRELKLKLLEIFFVWGNKDRFLDLAREMGASRADAPAGEWDKVLIMGKQIAPQDPLFAGTPRAAAGDLDMELHGGTATFDMTLGSPAPTATDVDLAGAAPASADDGGLDFVLDEPQRGAADATSLVPTVEMPQMRKAAAADDTEEVPIESLGLDTGSAQALDDLEQGEDLAGLDAAAAADDTVENPMPRSRAGDTVERPALGSKARSEDTVEEDLLSSTSLMRLSENLGAEVAPDSNSETAIYDLEDVETGMSGQGTARLEVPASVAEYTINEEAATMSEVGTKLDLARAYIDMGDPEGARSILEEVLNEGNPAQKQEAQRLVASLP